jgi:hypothetical protein
MDKATRLSSVPHKFFLQLSLPELCLAGLSGGLAIYFMVSAILGGIYNFSPVPFWDMWEGYLNFFIRLSDSDWSVWWELHNEHRIVLARILFWLDFKLFDGSVVFLIVCNYLLAVISVTMFSVILKTSRLGGRFTCAHWVLITSIISLCFSWIQSENFSWGFQSQFFLAQTLPLIALHFLFLASTSAQHKNFWFAIAAIVGAMCAGTMANGVIALPCMVAAAFFLRLSLSKTLLLICLASVVIALYLYGYNPPHRGGSPWAFLYGSPVELFLFTLTYLGGPFFYLAKNSLVAAQVAGTVLLLGWLLLSVRIFSLRTSNSLLIMLSIFVAYLIISALITSSGRVMFGMQYAVSSRYMTPALMAWCTMLIMLTVYFQQRPRIVWASSISALAIVLLLLPRQALAHQSYSPYVFARLIAALALEIGVKDDEQILNSYFNPQNGLLLANEARHRKLSVFANPLLAQTREQLGKFSSNKKLPPCKGSIDSVIPIPTDTRYLRVKGWIYRPDIKSVPRKLEILDGSGRIMGAALTGEKRRDIAKQLKSSSALLGFKGYVLSNVDLNHFRLRGESPDCELSLRSLLTDGKESST